MSGTDNISNSKKEYEEAFGNIDDKSMLEQFLNEIKDGVVNDNNEKNEETEDTQDTTVKLTLSKEENEDSDKSSVEGDGWTIDDITDTMDEYPETDTSGSSKQKSKPPENMASIIYNVLNSAFSLVQKFSDKFDSIFFVPKMDTIGIIETLYKKSKLLKLQLATEDPKPENTYPLLKECIKALSDFYMTISRYGMDAFSNRIPSIFTWGKELIFTKAHNYMATFYKFLSDEKSIASNIMKLFTTAGRFIKSKILRTIDYILMPIEPIKIVEWMTNLIDIFKSRIYKCVYYTGLFVQKIASEVLQSTHDHFKNGKYFDVVNDTMLNWYLYALRSNCEYSSKYVTGLSPVLHECKYIESKNGENFVPETWGYDKLKKFIIQTDKGVSRSFIDIVKNITDVIKDTVDNTKDSVKKEHIDRVINKASMDEDVKEYHILSMYSVSDSIIHVYNFIENALKHLTDWLFVSMRANKVLENLGKSLLNSPLGIEMSIELTKRLKNSGLVRHFNEYYLDKKPEDFLDLYIINMDQQKNIEDLSLVTTEYIPIGDETDTKPEPLYNHVNIESICLSICFFLSQHQKDPKITIPSRNAINDYRDRIVSLFERLPKMVTMDMIISPHKAVSIMKQIISSGDKTVEDDKDRVEILFNILRAYISDRSLAIKALVTETVSLLNTTSSIYAMEENVIKTKGLDKNSEEYMMLYTQSLPVRVLEFIEISKKMVVDILSDLSSVKKSTNLPTDRKTEIISNTVFSLMDIVYSCLGFNVSELELVSMGTLRRGLYKRNIRERNYENLSEFVEECVKMRIESASIIRREMIKTKTRICLNILKLNAQTKFKLSNILDNIFGDHRLFSQNETDKKAALEKMINSVINKQTFGSDTVNMEIFRKLIIGFFENDSDILTEPLHHHLSAQLGILSNRDIMDYVYESISKNFSNCISTQILDRIESSNVDMFNASLSIFESFKTYCEDKSVSIGLYATFKRFFLSTIFQSIIDIKKSYMDKEDMKIALDTLGKRWQSNIESVINRHGDSDSSGYTSDAQQILDCLRTLLTLAPYFYVVADHLNDATTRGTILNELKKSQNLEQTSLSDQGDIFGRLKSKVTKLLEKTTEKQSLQNSGNKSSDDPSATEKGVPPRALISMINFHNSWGYEMTTPNMLFVPSMKNLINHLTMSVE